MATQSGCPRCHNEGLKTETNTYQTPAGNIEVPKYKCPNCGTRFFYEEDLAAIFAAAQMPRSSK